METYNGHVRTPTDAIILFEACRIGLLPRVQRRLSEKERQSIKSGSVFVWDEREAGMRRWTDGKSWSASRVSGSFLTYREMEGKRGGGGMDKTANRDGVPGNDADSDGGPDGYRYKPDGLMKQSFSITTNNGQHLHLISYFSRSSTTAQTLMQPSNDPQLRHIRPEKGMYPESTVHEQSNIPAVTRGPMSSPGYTHAPNQPPAYGRSAPYGYAPPVYPPSPMHTPPPHSQYSPYYQQHGPHGPYPGQSPLQNMHYPPPGYAQAPAMTAFDRPPPPLSNNGLPPPPAHQYPPPPIPQQNNYQNGYGYPTTGYAPYQPPPLQAPSYPPPPQQPAYDARTPQSTAPPQEDHQQYAARAYEAQQAASHLPQHVKADGPVSPHPEQQQQAQPGAPAPSSAAHTTANLSANGSASTSASGQTIPSISAMLNGGETNNSDKPPSVPAPVVVPPPPPGPQPSSVIPQQQPTRTNSTSPNNAAPANGAPARSLQDIPSHKLGFEANRDVQALRNLDKSTFKY